MGKRKTDLTLAEKIQAIVNKTAANFKDGKVAPGAETDVEIMEKMQSAVLDELSAVGFTQHCIMLMSIALVSAGKAMYACLDDNLKKGADLLYDLTDMAYREATKDSEEQKDET